MEQKHAIFVETLFGKGPKLMEMGQRVSGAMTGSKPYQRLVKALEGRLQQRGMRQLQESAAGALKGPYPGTMKLPNGQVVASKALEEAGVPLARQMGKAEALKTLRM
jgi:hypothetical protein